MNVASSQILIKNRDIYEKVPDSFKSITPYLITLNPQLPTEQKYSTFDQRNQSFKAETSRNVTLLPYVAEAKSERNMNQLSFIQTTKRTKTNVRHPFKDLHKTIQEEIQIREMKMIDKSRAHKMVNHSQNNTQYRCRRTTLKQLIKSRNSKKSISQINQSFPIKTSYPSHLKSHKCRSIFKLKGAIS